MAYRVKYSNNVVASSVPCDTIKEAREKAKELQLKGFDTEIIDETTGKEVS